MAPKPENPLEGSCAVPAPLCALKPLLNVLKMRNCRIVNPHRFKLETLDAQNGDFHRLSKCATVTP